MIFNSFIPVNENNFRAQMLGGEQHLLSHVSVANQSTPTTLPTVSVNTKYIYIYIGLVFCSCLATKIATVDNGALSCLFMVGVSVGVILGYDLINRYSKIRLLSPRE